MQLLPAPLKNVAIVYSLLVVGVLSVIGCTSQAGITDEVYPRLKTPIQPLACDGSIGCMALITGTDRSLYRISNPNGISGLQDYSSANYEHTRIYSTDTSVDVLVTVRSYVDTAALYPVDYSALPASIRDSYLKAESPIQSTHPEIVAKAAEIVAGQTTQAEAVEQILAWVGQNIQYDFTFSLPNDALSVLRNGSGVCSGFSNLAVALLRAAGVPARVVRVCVTDTYYQTTEETGRHAIVEAYYPDTGWVVSEPQGVINSAPFETFLTFDQCGQSQTTVRNVTYPWAEHEGGMVSQIAYTITGSIYGDGFYLNAAWITSLDRGPLGTLPSQRYVMFTRDDPIQALTFRLQDLRCWDEPVTVSSDAEWLLPTDTNLAAGFATFTIDASSLPKGQHTALVSFQVGAWSKDVLVTVAVVEHIQRVYLPQVTRISGAR